MAFNLGSVADAAWQQIDGVPANISGTVMQNFAQQSVFYLNNRLNIGLSGNNISDKYGNVLVNLTAAKTLSRMTGIGLNANWSLGEFRIDKGEAGNQLANQLRWHLNEASEEIGWIARTDGVTPIKFGVAGG